jgi:transposase InsO family protein
MCSVLNITRQNYYKYRNSVDEAQLVELGLAIRIKKSLAMDTGWIINIKKVRRIMKKYNLKVKYHKVFRKNMNAKRIEENVKPNLLKRNFYAEVPNQKWVTDITYLIYKGQRMYLSSIMDLNTRNIIA